MSSPKKRSKRKPSKVLSKVLNLGQGKGDYGAWSSLCNPRNGAGLEDCEYTLTSLQRALKVQKEKQQWEIF